MSTQSKKSSFLDRATLRLRVSWMRWRLRRAKRQALLRVELAELHLQLERLQEHLLTEAPLPEPLPLVNPDLPTPHTDQLLLALEEMQPEPVMHLTPGSPLEIPEELMEQPPAQEEIARLIGLPTPQR